MSSPVLTPYMSGSTSFDRQRVITYTAIAAVLGFLIGYFEQGSPGGGLVLGLAAGVAVPLGLVFVHVDSRYINT